MFSLRIEGGEALAKALQSLSERVAKKTMREALADAAEPIRRSASRHAPRRPPAPDIGQNIVISTGRNPQGVSVAVGPAAGFHYGMFLEYGTVKMPAQPFMRPAFDETAQKVIKTMSESLWTMLASRGISQSVTAEVPIQSEGGGGLL